MFTEPVCRDNTNIYFIGFLGQLNEIKILKPPGWRLAHNKRVINISYYLIGSKIISI